MIRGDMHTAKGITDDPRNINDDTRNIVVIKCAVHLFRRHDARMLMQECKTEGRAPTHSTWNGALLSVVLGLA